MDTAISTRGLTRRFGDLTAVDNVDLDIPDGGVVGIVGPNGAGKSTTIRMLLGLIEPTEGKGEVLGEPISHPERYAARVGALIENPALLPNITARANLESMAILRGVSSKRIDEVLATVGLVDRADNKVSEYSLGMKQRLGIAIALLPDPELLVLDEPTNGLDPAGIVEVRGLLRKLGDEGRTVVVSSHLLSEIEAAADYLIVIRDGRILFAGQLAELLDQERRYVELEPELPSALNALAEIYRNTGYEATIKEDLVRIVVDPIESADLNRLAIENGFVLRRLIPSAEGLEDVFLRMTIDGTEAEVEA
jgi:ABC-2 type transport system ATP-binding protein